MAEINLTQEEADALFKMEKVRADDTAWNLPDLGGKTSVPLFSQDNKEEFILDIRKGNINLQRQTYQNRARKTIILVRLDLNSPHRNPDGEEIGVPHIHLYREGFADKWAFQLPEKTFLNLNDSWQTLSDFMKYCNVVRPPNFIRSLFS